MMNKSQIFQHKSMVNWNIHYISQTVIVRKSRAISFEYTQTRTSHTCMKFMRWILQQKNETAQKSDKWNFPYDILRRLVFIYIRSGFNVSVISSSTHNLSCQFGWTVEKLLSLFLPVGHFNRKPANGLISFSVNCVNCLLFLKLKVQRFHSHFEWGLIISATVHRKSNLFDANMVRPSE